MRSEAFHFAMWPNAVSICLGLSLHRVFGSADFFEADEHWIEPEQRGSERHSPSTRIHRRRDHREESGSRGKRNGVAQEDGIFKADVLKYADVLDSAADSHRVTGAKRRNVLDRNGHYASAGANLL